MQLFTDEGRRTLSVWLQVCAFLATVAACLEICVCGPIVCNDRVPAPPLLMVAAFCECVSGATSLPACAWLGQCVAPRLRAPARSLRRPALFHASLPTAVCLGALLLQVAAIVCCALDSFDYVGDERQLFFVGTLASVTLFIQGGLVVSVRLLGTSTEGALLSGDLAAPAYGWVFWKPCDNVHVPLQDVDIVKCEDQSHTDSCGKEKLPNMVLNCDLMMGQTLQ